MDTFKERQIGRLDKVTELCGPNSWTAFQLLNDDAAVVFSTYEDDFRRRETTDSPGPAFLDGMGPRPTISPTMPVGHVGLLANFDILPPVAGTGTAVAMDLCDSNPSAVREGSKVTTLPVADNQ